jgi:predicted ArsR family transcriptional regulator
MSAPLVLAAHPVRDGLLALLAEGPVTANEAARQLGESSGSCSFHLRQLARAGLVEEAPVAPGAGSGRRRPWRLAPLSQEDSEPGPELGALLRELENEGYRRWVAGRSQVEQRWQADEAASHVLWLTPEEMTAVAAAVRAVAGRYATRDAHPAARPPDARPVALISRVFPLLPPAPAAEENDGKRPS